ncbi:bifunctional diaminohydroxyphosphoribosylaminopyrimidine deaminase/5-amino-6-(5-phosphoribosylamino)uracil reductase RibD [Sporolactobacillus sp. THM19-2]|uniref:bifunctional diaminohydroxyphosphoribosylaminopyrimidine deaminase/5-amino-6-(5-phosphoribosylamino)uracil reductase RibD n=1 Tax=Sporolactobacillus sp. THM19-2 TaxID=2511171 RepID=UPI00101E8C8E|nr:bifunctional diaminohydroxyphosphoribosylaminopyrimidine deaminase/5-amino-6-(5-phosphoribosylamino)uracil reductase RibD [Sporolactobacillus sp. THM19-2]RYL92571.1 bifunctional diaminohydroxyphosphoribosylaminopyrimidine deaminase/5-amino-6-(5-phosphoribosylamino)uracil reductase RibD [Sporolactobacillus sp. THM19-2]
MKDAEFMSLAIHLAKTTVGQTWPNPAVGVVVVRDGRVVGMGAHLKAGEAHAEVNALKMAGARAEGSTLYVTLEPCSHFGKTPPCADLIIKRRVRRVVIASVDPNPLVSGRGIQRMKDAGITVESGLMEKEAESLNPGFFHYMMHGTPFVTLKAACSLDGKTATAAGESQWITGEASRRDGQHLRSRHDAILVGIGTVLADDPRLTVRTESVARQPVRVVLDTKLRIPEQAQLLNDRAAQTWVITGRTIDEQKAARIRNDRVSVFRLPERDLRIQDVLTFLGEKGIMSLLVEGGAAIHGSFLKAGAFDRLIVYMAPKLIGGQRAAPVIGGDGIEHLRDAAALSIDDVEKIDGDLKITATRRRD